MGINFRLFTFVLFIGFGYSCQNNGKEVEDPTDEIPNIILIMVDDQGWGDLSVNGNPIVSTPNIDSLAEEGVSFDRFYVSAVCSPTRAELLTGRYSVRGGVYSTSAGGERLDLDEGTFVSELQDAGYATGAFGKWHNGMQYPYHPMDRGFDEFFGYCSGHWGSYFDAVLEHNGEIVKSKGYLTDVLTSRALDFVEENQDEPFFAYLPLNTPHSPMQVPDRWWSKFQDAELPNHRNSGLEKIDHSRAAYAMAENIDWNVGRIVSKVEELGIGSNTIIMYLSDNGPNGHRWNDSMKGIKGSTDEGGVRSPLSIRWPEKFSEKRVISSIASITDLYPTILDICGVSKVPSNPLDGQTLVPLLLGQEEKSSDRIIVNHWRGNTSLRSQRFRLDKEDQLFDMIADPGQQKNVDKDYPEVYTSLTKEKESWENTVLAELPQVDDRPFTIGGDRLVHFPARDANYSGEIKRSNRWPNCSFLTNWNNENDTISWDAEVLDPGEYEVGLYYTCTRQAVGSEIQLSFDGESISHKILESHDPPLLGAEHDRFSRGESLVKDFKHLVLGDITLPKTRGALTLKGQGIENGQFIDFRMLTFRKK